MKFAEEDLAYLEELPNARPVAKVFGRVQFWPDGPGGALPLAGAFVHLQGADGEGSAVTADEQGRYLFDGLNGGKYTVSAETAGFHMPEPGFGTQAIVEPRGCAQIDVTLKKNWSGSISGRLIRFDGTPAAAGIDLLLIRLPGSEDRFENPLAGETSTDEHGEYSFQYLRPGEYKLAVHACCFPVPRAPYPAIYWPAARSEEDGLPIVVADAPGAHPYDFHLPPEVRSARANGQVLLPDGSPAAGARVWLLKLTEGKNAAEEDRCCNFVDAIAASGTEGRFAFEIMDGVEYILEASLEGALLNSEDIPISFADSQTPIALKLESPKTQIDKR